MPNCFQLFDKSNPTEALVLAKVDEEICNHFGVEIHPIKYHDGWYDWVGFLLACGKTWSEIRTKTLAWVTPECSLEVIAKRDHMIAIIDFMESRYVTDAWVKIGRR